MFLITVSQPGHGICSDWAFPGRELNAYLALLALGSHSLVARKAG